ncbi:hypothetical protein [Bacteroides sp. 51]|uniref:hypothetical protein n=1 Tax=Bacteroides sp. 51 TaxID=2302938 RepID=UPI0013D0EA74|nr:hypothetical protein [Bacteroides sp. 51]NDV82261.1 hypothetical protein [Bacteroides sp. 51]
MPHLVLMTNPIISIIRFGIVFKLTEIIEAHQEEPVSHIAKMLLADYQTLNQNDKRKNLSKLNIQNNKAIGDISPKADFQLVIKGDIISPLHKGNSPYVKSPEFWVFSFSQNREKPKCA